MRMLFRAVNETSRYNKIVINKETNKYETSSFITIYKMLLFNSLKAVASKFNGDMILVIDGRPNWRKDYQKGYKLNRVKAKAESKVDFNSFFEEVDKILKDIEEFFPYRVLRVDRCEADDIAMIVGDYIEDREVILITSDHDWSQILPYKKNLKIWEPIKSEFTEISDYEKEIIHTDVLGDISRFTLVHSLIGDSGDDVAKVNDSTVFSDNFIQYLKDKQFSKSDLEPLKSNSIVAIRFKQFIAPLGDITKEQLPKLIEPFYTKVLKGIATKPEYFVLLLESKQRELFDNYNIYQIITKGKNKGKEKDTKDIYKNINFGKAKAKKIAESNFKLNVYLNSHPMYKEHLIRNNTLVDYKKIPSDIKDDIIYQYNKLENTYNLNRIKRYLHESGLGNINSREFFTPHLTETINTTENILDCWE